MRRLFMGLTCVLSKNPARVLCASRASVLSARPARVLSARPARVLSASPASVLSASPASVLSKSLACAALSLSTAVAIGLAPASAASIPRPFPGGPGAHSAAWHPVKGISRVLLLTVARGETATPSDRVAMLQCTSPGGTHPRAVEACRLLEPVSGDPADLKVSRDAACTKRYEPVTVSGSGMWDGHHLWFERTFGNPCELQAYTGAVFNF